MTQPKTVADLLAELQRQYAPLAPYHTNTGGNCMAIAIGLDGYELLFTESEDALGQLTDPVLWPLALTVWNTITGDQVGTGIIVESL